MVTMKNRLKLDETNNISAIIHLCLSSLAVPGSVLLVPTETVYGLVCPWDDETAKKRIFKLKGRQENKPLQMLLADIFTLKDKGITICEAAEKIAEKFCPGPITIVTTNLQSQHKIGFRVPNHSFMLRLIRSLGKPLAATSANYSGMPPALSVDNALGTLTGQPNLIVDGGPISRSSQASTVVEIAEDSFNVLREGPISVEAIEKTINY